MGGTYTANCWSDNTLSKIVARSENITHSVAHAVAACSDQHYSEQKQKHTTGFVYRLFG
jgi:uridine phosphorylase